MAVTGGRTPHVQSEYLSLRIPIELKTALDDTAWRRRVSMSDLVRDLLARELMSKGELAEIALNRAGVGFGS